MIPYKYHPGTKKINKNFDNNINNMYQECKNGTAIIVCLKRIAWRKYLPSLKEMLTIGKLPVFKKFKDGIIFSKPIE